MERGGVWSMTVGGWDWGEIWRRLRSAELSNKCRELPRASPPSVAQGGGGDSDSESCLR